MATFDVVLPTIPMINVHSIQGDIRNSVAFNKPLRETKAEVVFHTASIIDMRPIPSQQMYDVNIEGTRVIVEQCRLSKHCKTLVYTSSIEVVVGMLSNGKEQIPDGSESSDETMEIPENHFLEFGATKATAEKLVLEADGQDGLRTCSIRPGAIIGDGCVGHQIEMKRCAQYYGYDLIIKMPAKISCVNVKSAAALHILAAEQIEISAGQSLFAGDCEINYLEMTAYAFQDTTITQIFLPLWFAFVFTWMLDRWERILHLLFNLCGHTRRTSKNVFDVAVLKMVMFDVIVSSKKAHEMLGWRPLMSKQQTMEETRDHANRFWSSINGSKKAFKAESKLSEVNAKIKNT